MNNMNDYYGLKPMTLEEEVNAPEAVRETRRCKIEIRDMCASMLRYMEQILRTARQCPEDNDEAHAELVKKYRDYVKQAQTALYKAIMTQYGGE